MGKLIAQCTAAGEGQYPSSSVVLNTTCEIKSLTTLAYTDEYSVVSGALAQTYEFKSSVGTDFITIADDATNTAIAWGTTPLSYTFGSAPGNLRVYRHNDNTCPAYDGNLREITVTCTTCASPALTCSNPTSPANNALDVSITPVLSWPAITNAQQYKVYISQDLSDCSGSPTYTLLTTTSNLTYTIPGGSALMYSRSYKWYFTPVGCDGIEKTGCDASNYFCFTTNSGPPANDDCAGAIALTVNADLACGVTTTGTTVGASQSTETAPSCSATGIDDDVWYTFVATGTVQTIVISAASVASTMAVYSGSCGALTKLSGACANTTSGTATLNLGGLVNGTTYSIRVYTTSTGVTGTFTLCVGTPPPPPANDECAGAIALTVNADLACGVTTSANTANATQSTETVPSCNATGIDDDIWYSFMATGAKHTLVLSSASVAISAQVYSGSCGSLVLLSGACASTSGGTATINLTGLTNGTTYRIRVYTTATSGNGTVILCVGTPVGTSCSDAVVISSLPYSSGTRTTCGSVDDYAAGSYCNSNYGGGEDYVFALTISNAPITVNFALGGAATWKIASVHTACPPTSGNCLIGFTTSSGTTASGCYQFATNGTYYIYIDTWPTPTCGEFTLDLTTNAPANDACINATNLTVNPDQACGTVTPGSTSGASQSTEAAPSCNAIGVDDDVWYSFSATATSQEVKITGATSITGFALYSGTCGALTQVSGACGTTVSGTGSFIATGLTISNIYYVRVFSTAVGCSASSSFNVCIGTLPACPAPTALGSSMITGTSAVLNWTENAGATNWDISYGVAPLANPNTGTIINTSTKPYTLNPPLLPSTTYDWYVRSYCGGTPSAWSSKATFSTLLANDNCSGAISLTVSNSATCGSTTNGTTVGATSSGVTGCAGTADDDVWYSFVAIAPAHTITVVGSASLDAVVDLRSGVCNGLNMICADATASGGTEVINVTALTIGATYFVRIYGYGSTVGSQGTFTVCVTTPTAYFVGSGNWSDGSKWTGGALPTCSRNVIINTGASCTIDMAAVVSNLTINGTVNLASNSLTTGCLSNGGNTIFSISSTGNLVMDGGTLAINGNFVMNSGGKFSQTGGDILIDPNTGSSVTSVASGTVIMALSNSASGNIVWSGGTITFVDPPFGSSTSGYTINYTSGSGVGLTPSGGHTVIMGGSSSTAGGFPFEIGTLGTSSRLGFYNLTVAGGIGTNRHTSTVTSTATVTVLNSLQIFSGSEYRGGTLNIATGLVNNGTLTTTTLLGLQSYNLNQSSAAMASSNVCTISGSGVWRNLSSSPTANMTSLTVNNTNGTPIVIPSAMISGTGTGSVSGTLTLTAGVLDLGVGTLTLGTSTGATGSLTTPSNTTTPVSWIAGTFQRWLASGSTATNYFPVGSTTTSRLIKITYATGGATTGGRLASTFNESTPGTAGLPITYNTLTCTTVSPTGYWQMTPTTLAGGTYTATIDATGFKKADGSTPITITDLTGIRLAKRPTAGNWADAATAAAPANLNLITASAMSGFSVFGVIGTQSALPVELTTFKGEAREKANMLYWQTASEINSAKYLVERAPEADNALFTPIGEVNAKGNTTTSSDYTFMDEKPLAESYYRLKIMDNDGSFEYSKIIVLQNASSGTGHVNVYPVPAHNAVTLAFQCNYSDDVKVVITDMNGRVVKEVSIAANKGQNTNEINIENLPMGMYHAHIYGADIESNVRIIRN